ncbi:MAG TPA: hypothetical protein VIO80_09805 [Candidatus Dormibacteraeota bacterium]
MTREDLRREIGNAFDSISGSPDPALPERVRAALVEAPEQRGPVWIGALAAAVIAVILVGVLLVGNPLNRGPLVPAVVVHPTPTLCVPTCPAPVPTPSPIPTPSPFVCVAGPTTLTTQTAPPLALIDAVRTGTHTGYDRITFEFKNGRTGSITITPQANTKFVRDAKGDTVTLAGTSGLLIKITGADNHTAFSGSTDIKTANYPGILEVREVGDYEGTVQWGVGLSSSACYHATILSNPTRLVIDIQTS